MILISIPVILVLILLDGIHIITVGMDGVEAVSAFGYIFACLFAFLGACAGIRTMEYLAVRAGFSGFSYYSWGVALFLMVLYFIT